PLPKLSVEINPRYRASEPNPNDNFFAVDLRPPLDLGVDGLSVSAAQLVPNQRAHLVTISFRVTNLGKQDVSTPFRTSVSPGNTYANGGYPTSYVTTFGLRAGQSIYVSEVVDSVVLGGVFNIRVEADPDHRIVDADRTNNIGISRYENPAPD